VHEVNNGQEKSREQMEKSLLQNLRVLLTEPPPKEARTGPDMRSEGHGINGGREGKNNTKKGRGKGERIASTSPFTGQHP